MLKLVSIDKGDPYILTLPEIKDYLFETSPDYDSMIIMLSQVAREYAEARTWKQIIPATYTLYLDRFPDVIELPKPPVIGVTSVKYYDTDDSIQELSSSVYQEDLYSEPARIRPVSGESWPEIYDRMNAVEIEFTAGMNEGDTAHNMPEKIRQAMLMLIKSWYENRNAVVVSEGRSIDAKEVPMTANALLDMESAKVYV